MANRRRERQARRSREAQKLEMLPLPYDRRNGILFVTGLLVIAAGYLCLAQPPVDGFLSLTLAPILLVIGYCGIIPAALILKKREEGEEGEGEKIMTVVP